MPRTLPRAIRPFAVAQYRILMGALTLSLFGAGMWLVAVVWEVIALGGGPVELSIVATSTALGLVAALLFGGVAADRIPQRRVLIAVESVKTVSIAVAAVLAITGTLQIWQLAVISFVLGLADGFFYPAYSALLPSVLPADQLLAANGVEGVLRPVIMQAAGPAVASALIAAFSPAISFAFVAASQLLGVLGLVLMKRMPLRVERERDIDRHPFVTVLVDVRDGFVYMVKTPWLLGTLSFACLLTLVVMGPIEVLLPFAVKDQAGAGAGGFAVALAAFGIGGAIGSITVASFKLPRRYLTLMVLAWGAGCLPLAVIGFASQLWMMVIALFVVGVIFQGAGVVWGTLLQRRVPPVMLGRVSSLDFFVSLALMPISMALAGPVGERFGLAPAFLFAGVVPILLAVVTLIVFRMGRDELSHPLDVAPDEAQPDGAKRESESDASRIDTATADRDDAIASDAERLPASDDRGGEPPNR